MTPKTKPTEVSERQTSWRMVALGILLVAAGVAGVAFAWFPAPPHSTAAPIVGWPGRWFAAGVGWFGVVVVVTGVAGLRGRVVPASPPLRRAGRAAFALAVVCWTASLVSLALRYGRS
jgi:hypothetical protein